MMPMKSAVRIRPVVLAAAIGVAVVSVGLHAQRGGTPRTDAVAPVNDGPNPYRVIRDWAQFTGEDRPWGGSNGVAIDADGRSVWAVDRCSPGTVPGCLGSAGNPVHLFGPDGREVRSFGAGMFVWPHGIHVDADGNVWVADARAPGPEDLETFPGEGDKGSVVVKFSPAGEVLMTLGTPGVRGNPPEALTDPTDVVTDPATGDVYVAESHTNVTDPDLIGRISVFDRTGRFLRTIGRAGTGPGEFRTPHAIEFDSQGRLVVADRHNHRIQVLTTQGEFVAQYFDFSRTSGLAIDADDRIYAADSESDDARHPGWRRGIRIGSLDDGVVTMFVPPHATDGPDGAMGEGIAIDADGNLFTAEAQLRGVTKYARAAQAAAQQEPPRPFDLAIVDRDGTRTPLGQVPGDTFGPRVSPDGTQLTLGSAGRVWIGPLSDPGALRPRWEGRFPYWSVDGTRMFFEAEGAEVLLWRAVDGSDEPEQLVAPARAPESRSPTGSVLSYVLSLDERFSAWTLDLGTGRTTPVPDSGPEALGTNISPDGRWIAYQSTATGRYEVWVQPLGRPGPPVQVSFEGGLRPVWSADGSELFFDNGNLQLFVAAVRLAPAFEAGPPQPLPITGFYQRGVGRRQYDLLPDGRFVMLFR